MKDILQDIVAHTYQLGIISLVKITGTNGDTLVEAMAEDRSVIVSAKTATPVSEFDGVFGMPNLDKLKFFLSCEEYKENAKIEVVEATRNGEVVPTGLHFENQTCDFQNDYRFMNTEIINEKLKSVKFKGTTWDAEFEPSVTSIMRLKYQSQAHNDQPTFQVSTEKDNLIFSFGDASTHAGSFVFQSNISAKLKHKWTWPVSQVMSILALSGNKTMKISDVGGMMITVDSGMATYDYILPAMSK